MVTLPRVAGPWILNEKSKRGQHRELFTLQYMAGLSRRIPDVTGVGL